MHVVTKLLSVSLVSAALLAVGIVAGGCSDGPPGSIGDIYVPAEFRTEFTLEVIGSGTVTMQHAHGDASHAPCVGAAGRDQVTGCGAQTWSTNGEVSLTAAPAPGWHFDAWYDEFNYKTTGDTQKVHGARTDHKVIAKFVPDLFKVSVIKAVFTAPAQLTTYTAEISNPHNEALTVSWVGPNCGDHNPKLPETKVWNGTTTMTWHHPHPACDASPAHASTRIGLVIAGPGGVVACHYNGAEDGVGPACE
jgi:hypothetical protein